MTALTRHLSPGLGSMAVHIALHETGGLADNTVLTEVGRMPAPSR